MFDPLNSTASIFANGESNTPPPWPTTPHEPNSPIPNLRRATQSTPVTPRPVESDGPYGREPRIYGQPEPGLISPQTTTGSNGIKFEKKEPYLRVRITGMDRNRRDILVKFDAQVRTLNYVPSICDRHADTPVRRQICPTSWRRAIATPPGLTTSSNSFMRPCSTVARIPLFQHCLWPRHPLRRMKKMTVW